MKILAMDTSSAQRGTLALVDRDRCVETRSFSGRESHVALLPAALEHAMASAGWTYDTIGLIAITAGPGSFTGLRVAMSVAKGIVQVHRTPVVSIPTLTAIAARAVACHAYDTDQTGSHLSRIPPPVASGQRWILAVTDARRGELFAALYRCQRGLVPEAVREPARWTPDGLAHAIRETVDGLDAGTAGRLVIDVVGEAVPLAAGALQQIAPDLCSFMPHVTDVDPVLLARIGMQWYRTQGATAMDTLEPLYLRRSAAETAGEDRPC
jgi:tRNA threonylcarbamoyladenosine biosynthesis protein TsaB